MKFLKILTLFSSIVGAMPFALAMDKGEKDKPSDEKAIIASQKAKQASDCVKAVKGTSPLDVVTEINDIQDIIRAYASEWVIWQTLVGHSECIYSMAIALDNKFIVTGSSKGLSDALIKIWDFKSGKELRSLQDQSGSIHALAITADRKYIISCSDNAIKIWDGSSFELIYSERESGLSIAITSDNKYIIFGCFEGKIIIFDLSSLRTINSFEIGHSGSVCSIAITSDNKFIVSCAEDKAISLWDFAGKLIRSFSGHDESVCEVIITTDNKYLISSSCDKTIKIWDLNTGILVKTLVGHDQTVTPITLTPDDKYIISGSGDNTIKVWDFKSGDLLQTIKGHDEWIRSIKITTDNKFLVSASDKTIKIWKNLSDLLKKRTNLNSKEDKSVVEKEHFCANSGCTNKSTKRCAKCKLVHYCAQECQKAHWSVHKALCNKK